MAGLPPGMGMPAVGAAASAPAGFQWTPQDVKDAVADLMALLPPPKKVQSSGVKTVIAVVGPKGGKTISSIAIPTNRCGGLPRPKGSIVVVLHGATDTTAPNSFDNFLFAYDVQVAAEDMPIFVGLGEPRGRYRARQKRSDPLQSVYITEVVSEFLAALGARGDVGLLVFDGFGDYFNQVGNYIAAYRNGFDSPLKLEGVQWHPRGEMAADLLALGKAAIIPGGFFVYNGPSGGFDEEKAKDPQKLQARWRKSGWTREPPAKWLMKRECHQSADVMIETDVAKSPNGEPIYGAEIYEGRQARIGIMTGMEANITGANIGKFCDLAREKAAAQPNGTAKVEVKV
jgi:hypothetical protein